MALLIKNFERHQAEMAALSIREGSKYLIISQRPADGLVNKEFCLTKIIH